MNKSDINIFQGGQLEIHYFLHLISVPEIRLDNLKSYHCSGGVYPRQEPGAYHLLSDLADPFVGNGVTRRVCGGKPRPNNFFKTDRPD